MENRRELTMQQTQILTYGIEGSLAERLRELAQERRFWLRETNQLSACQNVAQTALPPILVIRLGRDLDRELTFLNRVHACLPGTAVIAVGEADNPVLAGLVWELGATFALFPPTPVEAISELIVHLLRGDAA